MSPPARSADLVDSSRALASTAEKLQGAGPEAAPDVGGHGIAGQLRDALDALERTARR